MSRRHDRPRRIALAAAGLSLVAGVGACGLPRSSTAVQVPTGEVPYGLIDTPSASPTPTASPGVLLTGGTIYLVDAQQRLFAVEVQVPQAPVVPTVQTLLNRLAVGPSDRDRVRGLVTDLGPGSTIVLRSVVNGVASIELVTPNQDPSPPKLPVAVGQIVLTATSVVGVDKVVFTKDGVSAPVPSPTGGNLTSDPLRTESYTLLVAPDQPPITRTTPLPTPATPSASTTTVGS